MRFYSRLTAANWLNLFAASLWIFIGFARRGHSSYSQMSAWVFIALIAFGVGAWMTTFWEMTPAGLYERRLFASRVIPYETITEVGPATYEFRGRHTIPGGIRIDFSRPAPVFALESDQFTRGTMKLIPAHPDQLLTALRVAAPQALFDKL